VSKAEAEQVTALMESVVDGERTAVEASHILEINVGVIEAVTARMAEQRLGVPATPADSMIDYCARMMLCRVMRSRWD
jgi:hypothetical protein